MEYLVAGTALIFIMGNIADSKIKKASKHWDISDSEDAINFVTSYRNELSYSKHTKDIVNLITMKEGFPGAIVGSGKFRTQSYPGDIDLMEKIEMCCSKRDIARFVTERLQRIARDIKESEHVYLGDFKAGLDKRYQLNYGFINLNYKLVGYNRKQIVNQLSRMRGDGLFTKRQYDGLIELLPPNARDRHIHQWEKFRDAYRKYFVVRWSIDAVIRGYKNIGPKNKKIRLKLEDAVCHRTIVKLDVWAEVDKNLFTEVTNVFLLLWSKTKRGKKMYLNLPMGDYIHKMLYEIKHYGSGDKANYMKTLKRMWSLATYLNRVKPGSEKKYISKLKSLFTEELSVLYQLYSEAEVIEEMVSKLRNPPYKKLASQLDRFKARFNTVWQGLPQPEYINFEVEFYKRIDKLIEELNKPRDKIKRNFLKKHLGFIQEGLLYLWNGRIDKKYLKKIIKFKHHLNPKYVGKQWDVKEWDEAKWASEIKDALRGERDAKGKLNITWGVRRYINEKCIDLNHFDHLLKDKYILTKPVPAEEVDGDIYEERYMINPDLTYS